MKALPLCLLLLLALPLAALPRVAYLGASALLPGSGELLLGKTTRGAALLGVDVLALNAWLETASQKDALIDSYQNYAQVYAGIPEGMDEQYYQHIQEYLSSDNFNQFEELWARNYYLVYNYDPDGYSQYLAEYTYGEEEAWSWQSKLHQEHYRSLRRQTQTYKMYQNLSLGIIILNRVFSVVDVALLTRARASGHTLYLSPLESGGMMLNYQVEF